MWMANLGVYGNVRVGSYKRVKEISRVAQSCRLLSLRRLAFVAGGSKIKRLSTPLLLTTEE